MFGKGGLLLFDLKVYAAKFHKDCPLQTVCSYPKWLYPIQAGASLTEERVADILDSMGENISHKNANYCELTVLYWIWKNCLGVSNGENCQKYYGLFHYRRWLDLSDADMEKISKNDIDVILPFPTVHEPDISEHHTRYIKEQDWDAMLCALKELSSEYYKAYDKIFSQKYMYNYNILIAKTDVLRKYCEWLFPILKRVEQLSAPKGDERADRYIGYIGENLLTLYFMSRKDDLNIVHTGRTMLT